MAAGFHQLLFDLDLKLLYVLLEYEVLAFHMYSPFKQTAFWLSMLQLYHLK
jgi:hypothetical protein